MGRTLPSITQAFYNERNSLRIFRRALRFTDQRAFDDLFAYSKMHLAESAFASHLMPFEVMLLSMILEEHKSVMQIREHIAALESHDY